MNRKPRIPPRKVLSREPSCKRCKVEFEPGRLNTRGHCRHCADELMERHPMFSGAFHEPR